ncbi:MAG: pitrilysin family protein [Acidobacteria bacterium]|nr:pitrilysin family protein [Acidobacteriota bacterium]
MKIDRSRPPVPGAAAPFTFPVWERHRLANGVQLMVLPETRIPLAHVEILLASGAEADPLEHRGLTPLASGLLDEGTQRHGSIEIADTVELLGASLFTSGDWDGVYVGTSSLSRHSEELFRLIAEIVRTPSFPPVELERLRRMGLADLANRASQPGFVAGRHVLDMVYGREHPYGESLAGTAEGLSAIERNDLRAWHRQRARPAETTIVDVGDVTAEQIGKLSEEHFGDWAARESHEPRRAPAPAARVGRRVRVIDRPNATQTELRVARVGLPRDSPSFLAARLLNLVLGGKFTSRLNLNLRENRAITYGVHSRLSGRRGPGPFTVSCAVDSEATGIAVGEIIGEIDRLAAEPGPIGEIADAKNYLLGTLPYRIQTLEGRVDHLAEIALYSLADDFFRTLPAAVEAVSTEELESCAGNLLRTDDLAIAAVGPAAVVQPQLEAFGELEVIVENGPPDLS